MRRFRIISLILIAIITFSYISFDIVDNRDYEGDDYELYYFNSHIGYINYFNIDFINTGKTL